MDPNASRTVTLRIVETSSHEVIQDIDVSGETPNGVQQVLRGLLHQINRNEYHVEEISDDS